MNKYILYSIFTLSILCSCSDIDGDYGSIVPNQYHTIISLKESGVQDITMSVADGMYSYELSVLKGGVDTESVTDVMVEILNQEYIDINYNETQGTNYKVIPASIYSLDDYHLKIQPGQSGKSAIIRFDARKLYAAIQQETTGATFVLPVTLESANYQINPDRNIVILQCTVSPVVVGLESSTKKITIPDNESYLKSGFVIEKRGDLETKVKFEVMSQQYLDEHYSNVEGIDYKALTPEMYSMENTALIEADEQFHTHPVSFDVDKIRAAADNSVLVLPLIMTSETPSAIIDRSEILLICAFHDYTMREMTNKDSWSILYGTAAMPYGPYKFMYDGNDDGDGWMSYICDGFPGSQNFGEQYVVFDLGSNVMIGECGVQVGFNGGWWDVIPTGVDFYIAEDSHIDPELTSEEWDLINCRGNYGDPDNLSQDYITVHNRLREYDNKVEWIKIATISGLRPSADCTGQFWATVPQSILSKKLLTRYLKVIPHCSPYGTTPANRAKINELHLKEVTAIDGSSIEE